MEWWNSLNKTLRVFGVLATGLVAIFGAIETAPAAWRTLGLPVFITETALEHALKPFLTTLSGIQDNILESQLQTAEVRRQQISTELFERRAKLTELLDGPTRISIERRIDDLMFDRDRLIKRIEQLQKQRYGNH